MAAAALLVPELSHAASLTTLVSMARSTDGSGPLVATLTQIEGKLYGATQYGGTAGGGAIFALSPANGAETLVTSFPGGVGGHTPEGVTGFGGMLYGVLNNGGKNNNGFVLRIDPGTGEQTILHEFSGHNDGGSPNGPLLRVGAALYGTTQGGGKNGLGTLFKLSPETGKQVVIHDFAGGSDGSYPVSPPIDVGGVLYGTTSGGGNLGFGTLYRFDPTTGVETVLYSFAYGTDLAGMGGPPVAVGGTLYGTGTAGGASGRGGVFAVDETSGAERVLYSFPVDNENGGQPFAGLAVSNGLLYGTTYYGGADGKGAIFVVDPASGSGSIVHSFSGGNDAANPDGQLLLSGGALYGASQSGAALQQGAVFKFDPATNAESVLHSFSGGGNDQAGVTAANGTLYSASAEGGSAGGGEILKTDLASGTTTSVYQFTKADYGLAPNTPLLNIGGMLWGTTRYGGAYGYGTVFRVDPSTGAEAVFYSFAGGNDGANPQAALIVVGGELYGTTFHGGAGGCGTVFKVNARSRTELVLHAFAGGSDGCNPAAALLNVGGVLYGTTFESVYNINAGTVFKFDTATGTESVVYSFPYSASANNGNAQFPASALINVGGILYGTAPNGGGSGGAIYKIDPATQTETVLSSFGLGSGPGTPYSSLLRVGSMMFGTTLQGGTYGHGTIYKVNPRTGAAIVLYSFTGGADGGGPTSALSSVGGVLYGATNFGGAYSAGTVFAFTP